MIERTPLGSVTMLRMAHGKANAFDPEFLEALEDALAEMARSGAPAAVVTGSDTIFSAGVELKRLLAGGREYLERFLPLLTASMRALFEYPGPLVAAINGHAIAGGCIIACACDRRIMARGPGRIGAPELKVGVPFPYVPLDIVRHALPAPLADEAILGSRTYTPEEAHAAGLVDELADADRLLERAREAAESLAAFPARSYALTKRRVRRAVVAEWDRLGSGIDAETIEAWASEEVRSAVQDYVEKTLVRK